MDGQASGIMSRQKMRASDQPSVRAASSMEASSDSKAPSAVRYMRGKLTTTAEMTAASHVKTSDTPCAMNHWPTGVACPNRSSSRKPHTVGGSTMGMVKTESSAPFRRLDVPIVRQAAMRPSTNVMASATALVLSDTQNGR